MNKPLTHAVKEIRLEQKISDKILELCLNIQQGDEYTFKDLQGITEAMAMDIIKLVRED